MSAVMKATLKAKILVVDDEPNMGWLFTESLGKKYKIVTAQSWPEGRKLFQGERPEVVLLDLYMPEIDGLTALREIKALRPEAQVIMMTAYASVPNAVEAMKAGAFDYLVKPFAMEDAEKAILKALEAYKNIFLAGTWREASSIIGKSPQILKLLDTIAKVAPTNANVLLLGESGTGKELVAREIHRLSNRRDKPFVAINCAAMPENLVESELFGYEKGAFTGATSRKPGKFEQAHEGTLMLDEIADLPLMLQGKLLRALEQKEFERLGGTKAVAVDVRVISATNRDLETMVQNGEFRSDLFYRLAVVPIIMPPLREREGDVELLADHFLKDFSRKYNKKFRGFTPEVMASFLAYDWPGNVRELKNVIEQIVVLNDDEIVRPVHLPPKFKKVNEEKKGPPPVSLKDKKAEFIAELERKEICAALRLFGGNRTRAAKYLKISTRSLQMKIKELKITEEDYANVW
ncbi:MAG: two-component system, NtrC family, response regulator AtoC [Clostridia bacterium]|nr:two-component system, NtrC family, response regulator AtoC [Clostridia bacterium]